MTVLTFPQDSMSFIVQCQLVVYNSRSWLHGRHGVWVTVVGLVPLKKPIVWERVVGFVPLKEKPIAICLRCECYKSLIAFYDILGRKGDNILPEHQTGKIIFIAFYASVAKILIMIYWFRYFHSISSNRNTLYLFYLSYGNSLKHNYISSVTLTKPRRQWQVKSTIAV
jgi:hypothetical protein